MFFFLLKKEQHTIPKENNQSTDLFSVCLLHILRNIEKKLRSVSDLLLEFGLGIYDLLFEDSACNAFVTVLCLEDALDYEWPENKFASAINLINLFLYQDHILAVYCSE